MSRRGLVAAGLAGGAAVAGLPLLARSGRAHPQAEVTAATRPFNTGWLFGGPFVPGAEAADYDDRHFTPVTLPHTVTPLSWGGWQPRRWQRTWIYRRHLDGTGLSNGRVFLDFDGVMVNATVMLNDVSVGSHVGGYLPFSVELTDQLTAGDNVLAVIVDSHCLPVPPMVAGHGPGDIDYLQPGGIYRDVTLRIQPRVYLSDVFALPRQVLTDGRFVQVRCAIDAAASPVPPGTLTVDLLDGGQPLAGAVQPVDITAATSTVHAQLTDLGGVALWSPTEPKLYTLRVTLAVPGIGQQTVTRRIGFRQAVFRPDGFYLNGSRLEVFGLDRHQLYPYTGMAMSARLQRRDAEILRYELNCDMVRCSHYPQSPHFLDACDELGLLVWEEAPGWGKVGNAAWQQIALANVRDMVIRDRSRPSVVLWGTRLDETADSPRLYARARRIAYQLDGSRQTTGAMQIHSAAHWREDVFGFDDYHTSHGTPLPLPPLPGVPYLISEAVGALDGSPTYRWIDSGRTLARQALMHAQVHDAARADPRYAGVLGWLAMDYASLNGGRRIWDGLKTPGVLDTFRVPKPGAAIYRSQVDPAVRPVILPTFFWDFGPGSPATGPGPGAMVATNCDRLDFFVDGRYLTTGVPDRRRFGRLAYPPVFVDLTVAGGELRIDGYVRDRRVSGLFLSADPSRDRLDLAVEDATIVADGSDTTRVTFRAVDAYGNHRPYVGQRVRLALSGPADLIGDNPYDFGRYGGVGGAFIRSQPGRTGPVELTAEHPRLGRAVARLSVVPDELNS